MEPVLKPWQRVLLVLWIAFGIAVVLQLGVEAVDFAYAGF